MLVILFMYQFVEVLVVSAWSQETEQHKYFQWLIGY